MDDYSLTVFLASAKTLNFANAATILNLSPSAVSRQIKRLEDELGVQLFVRTNKYVELSSQGETFRKYAVERLDGVNKILEEMTSLDGVVSGELTIFASVTACFTILPRIVAQFRTSYPRVFLKLISGDSAEAISHLTDNIADIVIAAKPSRISENLEFKKILETPLVFIAPSNESSFSDQLEKQPFNFDQLPLIIPNSGISRQRIDEFFISNRINPNIYAQVSGNEAITALVSLGCGVGFLPKIVADSSSSSRNYYIMEGMPDLGSYDVGLCYKRASLHKKSVKAFVDSVCN
ncbi:MAG: HTH-type transcriptional activator IlvY [Spirochaetales bacterium]|nr:HTH-type transcriptional activator IlvY [Spirochaetales bacterium]